MKRMICFQMMNGHDTFLATLLTSLKNACSADDEILILNKIKDNLVTQGQKNLKSKRNSIDNIENEWLTLNNVSTFIYVVIVV